MTGIEHLSIDGMDLTEPFSLGGEWIVEDIAGWWDSPDNRSSTQERSGRDGDFPGIVTYASRMVTISGTALADGWPVLQSMRDRLAGLMPSGRGRLTITTDGVGQFTEVQRSGRVRFERIASDAAMFSITLRAPDPRKYGLVLHDSGQVGTGAAVEVAHAGNYPALPRLNVFSADFPQGYTVYRDGESGYNTRIFQPLTSGMVHSVDFATGVSSIQGTTTTGMLGRSRGIELDPYRLNTLNVVPYESSNRATVRWYWRDTWI